jgi:hypothetical protein
MTLFEGNIVSHFAADDFWGTSSHAVMFRNWFWGDASGNYEQWTSTRPDWGFVAIEIDRQQHYYAAVGNVLGNPSLHTNWNDAVVFRPDCSWGSSRTQPVVYGLGCLSQTGVYDPAVRETMILHGNYDFKTQGVAFWDGGADHLLKQSMYYESKPPFFQTCAWPAFGPDLSPVARQLPARSRFEGSSCDSNRAQPSAPQNLRIVER